MKQGVLKKVLVVVTVLIFLCALFWFVVVDWLIKMVIESQGTKAVGARVDVASVDLSLLPAGLELRGLAVTNPDRPMTNALAVQRIYSGIELMPLIKGKVIIDDLRMEGIRLNTARKSSGAVSSAPAAPKAGKTKTPPWIESMCATQGSMAFSIPKVSEIMDREKLQSLESAQELRKKIEAAKTLWRQRLNELPGQKELEAYKARLNKIKASGGGLAVLMGSAAQIKSLNDDLQADLSRIRKAKKAYETELTQLKTQAAELAQAPARELQRLKNKYAISAQGAANLSRLLFGPSLCNWWQEGYRWYGRLKPYIGGPSAKSAAGSSSASQTKLKKGDLPNFLIRRMHVDALLDQGKFSGEAADITSDPQIWTRPLTFKFLGSQMKQVQNIAIDGMLNYIQPGHPLDHVKMLVKNLDLRNLDLGDPQVLPLSIAKAAANLNVDFDLAGPELDALVKAQLSDVRMAVEKAASSEISGALADAVSAVTQFGLTALVKGSDPNYTTKIQSDLDQVLTKAIGQIIAKQSAKLESQLKAAIADKTKGPISEAQNELTAVNDLAGEFSQRLNLGDNLLKQIKLPF
jgi:uncharacterized protein (TIGR03545 family)